MPGVLAPVEFCLGHQPFKRQFHIDIPRGVQSGKGVASALCGHLLQDVVLVGHIGVLGGTVLAVIDGIDARIGLLQKRHGRAARVLEFLRAVGLRTEGDEIRDLGLHIGTHIETLQGSVVQRAGVVLISQGEQIGGVPAAARHVHAVAVVERGLKQILRPVRVGISQLGICCPVAWLV